MEIAIAIWARPPWSSVVASCAFHARSSSSSARRQSAIALAVHPHQCDRSVFLNGQQRCNPIE
ncbi:MULTISPECIES: hypothetical protein [Cyanophyceae]|uniref:hypothetical protein n=1 Tax=Cyanophyceae TaxID=3028117 RepID=UPI0019883629|nr:hypothetical protein [Trichocoleus sp. FACHB-69]MBD1931943.1 hypothetical protein [Trichocoleus sp. FACHB-69]